MEFVLNCSMNNMRERFELEQMRLNLDIWKIKYIIKLWGSLTLVRTAVELLSFEIFEKRKYLFFKIISLITFWFHFPHVSVDEKVKELNWSFTAGPMHI